MNRSYCWYDHRSSGRKRRRPVTPGICVDYAPCTGEGDCRPPQGKLRVHDGGWVRIDVGTKAKRVELGGKRARPTTESRRFWRWRVPRFGSSRLVELAVWYPRQPENPYRQGPVRLRRHGHGGTASASAQCARSDASARAGIQHLFGTRGRGLRE